MADETSPQIDADDLKAYEAELEGLDRDQLRDLARDAGVGVSGSPDELRAKLLENHRAMLLQDAEDALERLASDDEPTEPEASQEGPDDGDAPALAGRRTGVASGPLLSWRAVSNVSTRDGRGTILAGQVFQAPEGDPRTMGGNAVRWVPDHGAGPDVDAALAALTDDE